MAPDEEGLKRRLAELERAVYDPLLMGKGEEIWARMIAIREKTNILKEEMAETAKNGMEESALDDDVLRKVEKVSLETESGLWYWITTNNGVR